MNFNDEHVLLFPEALGLFFFWLFLRVCVCVRVRARARAAAGGLSTTANFKQAKMTNMMTSK